MAEELDNVAVKPISEETENIAVEQTNAQDSSEETNLKAFTDFCEYEMLRVKEQYPNCVSTFPNGDVASLNLKGLKDAGVEFYGLGVNRTHGADEQKTGRSILENGAQHSLIVITVPMADKAGIKVERFANDPNKDKPIASDGIVVVDCHGRIDFLQTVQEWPLIMGHFPMKDKDGYYNFAKAFTEININVSKWKTQDMVAKRQIEDGINTHEGWVMINDLVSKGYKYQAACQLATLKPDRLTARQVANGDESEFFINIEYGKRIHKALKDRFGEGDDKTIKTKEFTKEIVLSIQKLTNRKGVEWATDIMEKFINTLPGKDVADIKAAKSTKVQRKDEKRKQILDKAFSFFLGQNNIKL